jgi:uncharacterized damage-inducible protein DinB
MSQLAAFAAELKQEAVSTRKMLEKVPYDKKEWKPHEKSMTLGKLATHVAETGRWVAHALQNDGIDFSQPLDRATPQSTEELVAVFEKHYQSGVAALESASEADLGKNWVVRAGDKIFMEIPKATAIRGWALSHMVHHRGQLSVYLRLLGVPVPGMYGPSADETM